MLVPRSSGKRGPASHSHGRGRTFTGLATAADSLTWQATAAQLPAERGPDFTERRQRRIGRALLAQLEGDRVGTCVQVVADPPDDVVDVADGDHGLEQPITAVVGDVVVAPANTAQVVGVVGQRQVVLAESARDLEAL